MRITETFQVDSPQQKVWDFITDPHKMAGCLPSVQSVEVVDDTHYKAVVKQKVGFISATFEINTEVLEKQAPSRLVLSNNGRTILGANGSLKSTDTITLASLPSGATEVKVDSELTLGGKLAILGAKLIESKSREIFAEATENLRAKVATL
jgi:carbon monoxide dehydrogenase subunit G